MPERINHIRVTSLSRWTHEELLAGMEAAEVRLESVWSDLAKYNGEIATRETVEIDPIEWIPYE